MNAKKTEAEMAEMEAMAQVTAAMLVMAAMAATAARALGPPPAQGVTLPTGSWRPSATLIATARTKAAEERVA